MSALRIALDAHWLVCRPQSSATTYLTALIRGWDKLADAPEVRLLVPRPPGPESAGLPLFASRNVRVVFPDRETDPVASYRAQFFWQQNTIPALLRRNRPDVYLSTFHLTPQLPLGLKMVTTIHDICFLSYSKCSYGSLIHRMQVWSAFIRSARLICVSRFTRDSLSRWAPQFARKARVVHNGIDTPPLPMAEARLHLEKSCPDVLPGRYLVWVGDPSPRKNPELLFEIFGAHHRRFPGHKFVVVAPAPTHKRLQALAQTNGILPELRLMAGIADVTRDALYRCALALVFPSQCEGFGYPVLEAMTQGCLTVSFQNGPVSELLEGIVPLAAAATPQAFMDILDRHLDKPETERAQLGERLMTQASRFSSKAMADGTLAVLREAVAESD